MVIAQIAMKELPQSCSECAFGFTFPPMGDKKLCSCNGFAMEVPENGAIRPDNCPLRKVKWLGRMPFDGVHSVEERLPEPNMQLIITCATPPNFVGGSYVGGGAAAYGEDGKWYWTMDEMLDFEISSDIPITHWQYMPPEDSEEEKSGGGS